MENINLAQAVDLVAYSGEPVIDTEEELTQDMTVVEFASRHELKFTKNEPKLSRLDLILNFLFNPYNPKPLSIDFRRYCKAVRKRMIESREFDRAQFFYSPYQRFRRHVKANLAI